MLHGNKPNYIQLFGKLPHLTTIKDKLGVTTMELLIVMVAVPSLLSFSQNNRLKMTADNLFAALQLARSEAIKRSATIYVSIRTGDNWCYGFGTGSGCNCATANTCNLGTTAAPQTQQISLSSTGISGNAFQIEGTRGAANVSGAKILMTLYGQSVAVGLVINQVGNMYLCSSSFSGYQTCP